MTYKTHLKGAALAAICAVTLVACEGGMPAPTSPSAVVGSGGAASNPDGTTVKATAPVGLAPTNNATGVSLTPTLSAQAGAGKYGTGRPPASLPGQHGRDVRPDRAVGARLSSTPRALSASSCRRP